MSVVVRGVTVEDESAGGVTAKASAEQRVASLDRCKNRIRNGMDKDRNKNESGSWNLE